MLEYVILIVFHYVCVGWVAPVFTLLQLKLIEKENCDYTKAFTEFFSGGSCLARMPEDSVGYVKLTSVCGEKSGNGFEGIIRKI